MSLVLKFGMVYCGAMGVVFIPCMNRRRVIVLGSAIGCIGSICVLAHTTTYVGC